MSINHKFIVFVAIVLFSFSHQVSAIGERLSKAADSVTKTTSGAVKSLGVNRTAGEIEHDADTALNKLLKSTPAAAKLSKTAKGILIFPKILKAGLMIGGQHGEGALKKNGQTVAFYSSFAGSYGLQAGAQSFSYAMFFMDDKSLEYLGNSDGWEVGVGPSVVIVDEGMAKSMTSTTTTESVYVFTFSQGGLMAGAGVQGSKISKINPDVK